MKDLLLRINSYVFKEIVIVLLAVFSIFLLVYELTSDLAVGQIAFIHTIDLVISLFFLVDFIICIYLAPDKRHYIKHNWFDLLASIPITSGMFRSLRSLRILRIVRVIRVLARVRRLGTMSDSLMELSSRYIYILCITTVVILTTAVAFFTAEVTINPQVHTFFDAVWWAVTTVSTVGYGDIIPMTVEGRIIAMFLMLFGVGLLGSFAGVIGSHLIEKR